MSLTINRTDAIAARPGAVIFDTDNTLYPYDEAHAAAMDASRRKAMRQLSLSPAQFDDAYAKARQQIKARLEGTASSHSRLLYFQRMLEIVGLRTQVLLALDFEQTYWRVFLTSARLFEGVKDFLDDLRLAGIPTAIVTDLTAQIQFRKIVYFGLDHYFDYVVTSEEAGFDKPHEASFALTLEKLGDVRRPIWMIGDNPICDIQGARTCIGAVTLQKAHAGVKVMDGDAAPDAVFGHFSELRTLMRRLLERETERAAA
ncbi:MAG: HAD family hydrolase [Pseudomonadota bacterium]